MQVDQALVNAQLVHVPGLATLTARRLAGRDLEVLGRQPDGALDREVLGPRTLDQLGADTLQRLNLAARQGDADAVRLLFVVQLATASRLLASTSSNSSQTYRRLREVLLALLVRHLAQVYE